MTAVERGADPVTAAIAERLDDASARGLATAVAAAMRAGELPAGTRLPPIRSLAGDLGLSPTTVSAAWSLLRRSGTVRTDGRRGSVVGELAGAGGAHRLRRTVDRATSFEVDLAGGVPDAQLLPDLRPALRSLTAAATPATYLDEPTLPELESLIQADWPFPVDALMVLDGAMDAIELVARTVLQFGDRVIVEDPGFPPVLDLLEFLGARLVPVPVDAEGLDVEALTRALHQPASAVFLQPRAQNPTGVSLSARREKALARVLQTSSALIVEDDSAGAVASSAARSLGRHLPERTVHVRSYSKSHGPDLRLAALSAPDALRATLTARRELGQGWTSRLLQHVLAGLLSDRRSIDQVERARASYRERRADFVAALAARGVPVGGDDGINAWVPVADETAAVLRLATRGIGVAPGTPFMVAPSKAQFIRVTCGLISGPVGPVADEIAAATQLGSWTARR